MRQLPIAMMRIFPLDRVPRHDGSAVMRAPFLLACTLVTPLRRSVVLFTTRMLQRCRLRACPEVLWIAVKVLGSRLLRALLLVRCLWHLVAPVCSLLLARLMKLLLTVPIRCVTLLSACRTPFLLVCRTPLRTFIGILQMVSFGLLLCWPRLG